ncbi:MAG: porin, partial [Piscirickettsiaceae bacterium CG_4_9_14_0_2_um_filter_44_546]
MKKNMIALAIASAIAAPAVMADAPTVYGKVNSVIQSNKAGNDTGMTVDSVASRVGVKGSADLGNDLQAVYKFEFEVQMDKGDILKNRNQYVGLAGGFGTMLMGRHDT